MKMARILTATIFMFVCLPTAALLAEGNGQATVGVSYTFLDQTGNRSVSPETYDVYEDFGISIRNYRWRSSHRYELTANLENVNLDNRALTARLHRPGRISISGRYSKSRRFYDFDDANRTFRTRAGLEIAATPHQAVKLLGGYAHSGRDGTFLLLGGEPFSDVGGGFGSAGPQNVSTDYSTKSYYVGTQLRHRRSMLEARFRRSEFTDNLNGGLDRKGQYVRLRAFSPVPRFDQMVLSGGVSSGWSRVESRGEKRKENVGWGSVAWDVRPEWNLSYKLLFSRTDNEADGLETDNAVSTLFLAKRFPDKGEVSLGYEFRSQDDLTDRTETNAFIIKGAARPYNNLRIRGQVAFSQEKDDDKTTLVGGEEITRHRWEARYDHPDGHRLTVRYRDRRRDFEDIGSDADFQTIASTLTINLPRWGQGFGTYSYSKGDYHNISSAVEFEQHLVTARATMKRYRHVQLTSSLTYLRSRLHADVEKIVFSLGANIDLTRGYEFKIGYNAHTYDDFLKFDRYYTANVVTMEIEKRFNF